ncbi:MAG: c-type cytochrome, partial [Bacteroidia bacterium]|nr:c-type cytochrome [Bacteroidia bacterium]
NTSIASKLYVPPVIDPNAPPPGTVSGALVAWDPIEQKEVWKVPQVLHQNGGLLTTSSGLVFQGDAEGKFTARDASTGEALWQFDVRGGAIAPPVTYEVDGEQYITIAVGWGGYRGMLFKAATLHPGTVYTFKLGGIAEAPAKLPSDAKPLTVLRSDASPEQMGRGITAFFQYCLGCHATTGLGGGVVPDLARSTDAVFNNWDQIVFEGALEHNGMPNMSGHVSKEELENIRHFILFTAKAFSEGMSPIDYATNLGTFQYIGDQARLAEAQLKD